MRMTSCMAAFVLMLACGSATVAAQATGTCTFEKNQCGWKKGGKGKWVRGTRTPSSSTGAAKAHGGKYFMFLETSGGSKGFTSYLTHPVPRGYKSISFAYHMHGKTMGALSVQVQVGKSSKWTTIFKEAGQGNFLKQNDKFRLAQVNLPNGAANVRFTGVRGTSYTGDMSIDSVVMSKTALSICTFDNKNLCGWKNSGKGKWVRGTKTPSGSTGAAKGQGGKGYFMFLETSSPSTKGWTSYLTAAAKGKTTLSFYYHMHGATMGALSVHAQVGGKWKNVWSKSGQQQKKQGDKYIQAKAKLPRGTTHVRFVGVAGSSFTGDMSIDTVLLSGSSSSAKTCPGDFNGDKQIDAKDLLSLLGHFAASNRGVVSGTGKVTNQKKHSGKRTMCTGDLTGDKALDVLDLLKLLQLFGTKIAAKTCAKC